MARKTLVVLVILLVALGVILAGCQQGAATPAATKAPAATAAPAGGAAASGQSVFQQNCNGCHPNGEQGVGPSLKSSKLSADQIKTQVRNGKGQMPPFPASTISDQQLEALAQYTKGLQQ